MFAYMSTWTANAADTQSRGFCGLDVRWVCNVSFVIRCNVLKMTYGWLASSCWYCTRYPRHIKVILLFVETSWSAARAAFNAGGITPNQENEE